MVLTSAVVAMAKRIHHTTEMCDFICNYNFNACMRILMGIISWCRRVLMILYHHQSFHLQQRATRERIFGVIVSNALNLYVCSLFNFSLFSLHRIGKRNVDPNPCGIRFYSCKFFFVVLLRSFYHDSILTIECEAWRALAPRIHITAFNAKCEK